MKLKNLFEKEVLQESEEKSLIGRRVNGKVIDENTQKEVWSGDFEYTNKRLTSLKGSPEKVTGDFYCYGNGLTSLEDGPQKVGGSFCCQSNRLTSLKGAPPVVGGDFYCSNNEIASLHNIHKIIKKIDGSFLADRNPIQSDVLGLMLIDGIKGVLIDNNEVQQILNDGIKNKKHWTEVQAELEEAGFEEYAQL